MSCEGWSVGNNCITGEEMSVASIRLFNISIWFTIIPINTTGVIIQKWSDKHQLKVNFGLYGEGVLTHSQVHMLHKPTLLKPELLR